jgi:hypothetical protein
MATDERYFNDFETLEEAKEFIKTLAQETKESESLKELRYNLIRLNEACKIADSMFGIYLDMDHYLPTEELPVFGENVFHKLPKNFSMPYYSNNDEEILAGFSYEEHELKILRIDEL